jgi:hypothetical protein
MDSKRRSENDAMWSRIKTQIDGLKMATDETAQEGNKQICRSLLKLCVSLEDEGYFDNKAVLIELLEYVDKIMAFLSHDEAMKGLILS